MYEYGNILTTLMAKTLICDDPINLWSKLRGCGQMSNLESVSTLTPLVGNSFFILATLEPFHMESTVQWKLATTKKTLCTPQDVQICIPSLWHKSKGEHHNLTKRGCTFGSGRWCEWCKKKLTNLGGGKRTNMRKDKWKKEELFFFFAWTAKRDISIKCRQKLHGFKRFPER